VTATAAVRMDAVVTAVRIPDHPEYRELDLDAPAGAAAARPGQFVHIRLPGVAAPLLRRPFSLAGYGGGRITILFKRVGEMSRRLSELSPGDRVDVLGPLGTGFSLDGPPADRAYLVAGGYGVAPMLVLARALREARLARAVILVAGARSMAHLLWRDRLRAEADWLEAAFATDDGSEGFRGTVLDLLAAKIGGATAGVRLYGCGPMRMLAAIAARWPAVPFEAAVENQMGCGLGVCLGCVLPVRGRTGHGRYSRICVDGPVFDAARVDWTACPL
jgi:dihydroorotate dehydrogenase electron transfer subunit